MVKTQVIRWARHNALYLVIVGSSLVTAALMWRSNSKALDHRTMIVAKASANLVQQVPETEFLKPTITQVSDLITLSDIVLFEQTPESTFGEITDLVFWNHQWFILDKMTRSIFRFDVNGKFIARISTEDWIENGLTHPRRLRVCFDGLLGVCDAYLGKIFLFDQDGVLNRVSATKVGGFAFFARHNFMWNQEDRLVIPSFSSRVPESPLHVLINSKDPISREYLGFGNRCQPIERAVLIGAPIKPNTAFEEIDGFYWSGSPYTTYVDVYNAEGQQVARLGETVERDREKLIHPEDYGHLPEIKNQVDYVTSLLTNKAGNERISRIGDFVFVQMGHVFDVYRVDRSPVAVNLPATGIWMDYAIDDYLVMVIPSGLDLDLIENHDVKAALIDDGYSPEGNPAVVLFELDSTATGQVLAELSL